MKFLIASIIPIGMINAASSPRAATKPDQASLIKEIDYPNVIWHTFNHNLNNHINPKEPSLPTISELGESRIEPQEPPITVNETIDEPGGDSSSESEEFFDFDSNLWQSDVFIGKIQKDPC